MKYYKIICILFSTILLSGCFATGAKHENMAVNDTVKYTTVADTSKLHKKICVGDVKGGSETNPIFASKVSNAELKAALEMSLNKCNYASIDVSPEFRLDAELIALDQPFIGANMSVTSVVNYKITEIKSGKEIFNKSLNALYTAKWNSAFSGVTRLQLANEGSIKNNIETLLKELNDL